jgi:hypothetical protein
MITTSKAGGPASEAPAMETKGRSVLDTPQEPVIGLAEGETRWRGMTACSAMYTANELEPGAKYSVSISGIG